MTIPDLRPHLAYFHGQPGGAGEWRACAPPGLVAFAPDRNSPVSADDLAEMVAVRCAEAPLTLIGFSLGAPLALAVARRLGGRVAHLHLVSPAAPLALGSFLEVMAGGSLFRLARSHPALFRLLARLESLMARTAPHFLLDRLFATAAGGDILLRRNPGFRQAMAEVLRGGLGRTPAGFIAEVSAYVTDEQRDPAGMSNPIWPITTWPITIWPITIWQGDADNWTPPAMAQALAGSLADSLPGTVRLNLLPGCSHYSALRAALARI